MTTRKSLNGPLLMVLLIASVANEHQAYGEVLTLTIRPHVTRVVFGDPVCVEVSILTNSQEPMPRPDGNAVEFVIRDPNDAADVTIKPLMQVAEPSQTKTVTFEPDKPGKFYFYVFLPGLKEREASFWQKALANGGVMLVCTYRDGDNVQHRANTRVQFVPRDAEEMRALDRWQRLTLQPEEMGPSTGDFGIDFTRPLSRTQTAGIASQIKTGELADLLRLTIRLQDIYAKPASMREAGNRELVEWLQKQPDIMGQTLLRKCRTVAALHQMSSTVKALDAARMGP